MDSQNQVMEGNSTPLTYPKHKATCTKNYHGSSKGVEAKDLVRI